MMPRCAQLLAASLVLATSSASAKDLKRLSELVTPAYAAMSIAIMCARDDPDFIAQHTGPRGSALHYAQHVKDEVVEGLTHDEAVQVLTGAAGAARELARKKLYGIANPFDQQDTVRAVIRYCASEGRALVLNTIRSHDTSHDDFVEQVRSANGRD